MATYKYLDTTGTALLWEKIKNLISGKVDKVEGKGLSTNDYTSDEKAKLANIAAGAEVNVNADWNATTGDAAILNKPTIPSAGTGTSYPAMDGTRSLGSNAGFARVDHVHPSDTSRVPTSRTINGKELSADISLTASDVGALPSSTTIPTAGTGSSYPAMDGTRSLGSNAGYARVDHVHPKDTSKANLASPTFTGTPKAPTAASGTDTTQIATCEFVQAAVSAGGVTIDSSMSSSSTNPVQNKIVKAYIDSAIGGITGIDFQIVTTLPSTGVKGTIYLVSNSGSGTNVYDEYIYVSNAWEKIGTTDVDLSGYVQASEMVAITETEINQICV